MTTKAELNRTARTEFAHLLAGDHDFARAKQHARLLWGLADSLNKLHEVECNNGLTPKQSAHYETLVRQAEDIAAAYGCTIRVGGDPRGHAIHVLFPTPTGNTWGGDESGWGIGDN